MWFGWWSSYTVSSDTWAFQAEHDGVAAYTATELDPVAGSATYRGPAAGWYAIYEPTTGDSGTGSFTASATLEADFDANTVAGSITNFSNDPGWSLTLKRGTITGGTVGVAANGVTWTIDDTPLDSGAWEATFYSHLPLNESEGVQPYGIAGTFEAEYGSTATDDTPTAALIGAFGAHK